MSYTQTGQKSTPKAKYNHFYSPTNMSQRLEEQRRRVIVLERHVLETATFDFRASHPQPYIIKFTKHMNRTFQPIPSNLSSSWHSPASLENSFRRIQNFRTTKISASHPCTWLHSSLLSPSISRHQYPLLHVRCESPIRRRCNHWHPRFIHPPSSKYPRRPRISSSTVHESANHHSKTIRKSWRRRWNDGDS